MSTVYKYCGPHGLDILRNLELKVTPPNEFNDPFEFTPHIICSHLRRAAKQMVKNKRGMREDYVSGVREGWIKGSFRQFRELHKEHRRELIDRAELAIPTTLAKLQSSLLDNISSQFGVLCMSKRRNSLLMWGHYCDSHRGIVIGFDDSNVIFKTGPGLRPVNYVRARVRINIDILDAQANWVGGRDALVFSKNAEWAYEEEYRQLYMLSALKLKSLKNGVKGYFCPIHPSAIVSVTMGTKLTPDATTNILSLLRQPHFSHVDLDRAELEESEFALKFLAYGKTGRHN